VHHTKFADQSQMDQKADIALGPRHVRFTPESGHEATIGRCPNKDFGAPL
jgi:hypothetical protein